MRRNVCIWLFNFVTSGLSWFPMQMDPNYGWPLWVPACLVVMSATASAVLQSGSPWLIPLSSFSGVVAASVLGFCFWWPDDPIAGPWVPVMLAVVSVGALLAGILGSVVGYRLRKFRIDLALSAGTAALVVVATIAAGAIAGNSVLVAQKIHRDRLVAEERVRALYQAAARAVADYGDVRSAHDSFKVRGHYRGPAFNDEEWQGMTRNLLRRNGYVYQIHIAQPPAQGVLVYAHPIEYRNRVKEGLCLDDSGRMRCPLEVMRGQACVPCEW